MCISNKVAKLFNREVQDMKVESAADLMDVFCLAALLVIDM